MNIHNNNSKKEKINKLLQNWILHSLATTIILIKINKFNENIDWAWNTSKCTFACILNGILRVQKPTRKTDRVIYKENKMSAQTFIHPIFKTNIYLSIWADENEKPNSVSFMKCVCILLNTFFKTDTKAPFLLLQNID